MAITPTPASSGSQSISSTDNPIKEAEPISTPVQTEATFQQFYNIVQKLHFLKQDHKFSCSTYIVDETGLSDLEKEAIVCEHPVLFGSVTSLEEHLAKEEHEENKKRCEEYLNRLAEKLGTTKLDGKKEATLKASNIIDIKEITS